VRVRRTSPSGPSLGATGTLTRISAPQSGQGSQATVDIHVDLLDPKRSEDLHHPHMERPTTEIPATTHTAEITDTTETRPTLEPRPPTPPGPFVVAVGLLVALWCAGFAAISVWFEFTGYFGVGQYADDATAISVVNWFVAVLKVLGAAVALLAVSRTPRFLAPRIVGTLLWAAFATLAVYVVGSITQAVVMLAGVAGDAEEVDALSVGYVLAFLLAATGFGILATSYARRAGLGARVMLIGVCGAPVVLGSVLVILPAILRAVGLLSVP
jgi:hypothetical protein